LDSDPERARELATSLVGLLEPTKIETDEARTLFNETELAGGPPAIPENPLPAGGFIQAQRLVERLQQRGEWPDGHELLLEAVAQLESDMNQARLADQEEGRLGCERLKESLPRTYGLLVGATGGIEPSAYEQVLTYLVNSAELLAGDPDVLPGSEIGSLVLALFVVATHSETDR
jgi:hypothetical protein